MIEFDKEAVIRIRRCLNNIQVTGIEQAKNIVLIEALLNTGKEKQDGIRDSRLDETERAGLKPRKQKKAGRTVRYSGVHRDSSPEHPAVRAASDRGKAEQPAAEQCDAKCDNRSRKAVEKESL